MKPILQALLLADHVYLDRETGKAVIAGVFSKFTVMKRPDEQRDSGSQGVLQIPITQALRAGNPFAYISLTEVRGTVRFQLRLVRLESNEVCFQTNEMVVECEDPLRTVQLVLPVLSLPHIPGTYCFELLCENELIGSHRVIVEEVPMPGVNP